MVCGLSGAECLGKEDLTLALAWLDYALTAASREKPDAFGVRLRLLRAQTLDALGRRGEAVAEYGKVLAPPDFDFARARAAECASTPCGRDEILRRLRAMSKEE
mgnify:CR=1 FL=1